MQIDKFYRAAELRKEIAQIETSLQLLDTDKPDVKILEKLSVPLKTAIADRIGDLVKKELQKIIKQKEKEFADL